MRCFTYSIRVALFHLLPCTDTFWGVFRSKGGNSQCSTADQTAATKDGAQIERHLVRTHSKKGDRYLVGAVSHGRSNFAKF